MEPSPGVVLGRKYRLDRPLASGGMGSIWVARHTELDVDVAVKLMTRERRPKAVERFRREARIAALLKSPNVIQIIDYGVDEDMPYMVMELLDGEDLDGLLTRAGRLSVVRTLEIMRPVCKALTLVHDSGLVHRDIKPANIFLAKIAKEEVVKVVDFGIARIESDLKLTDSASLMGSPAYMSPEQLSGEPADKRADIWALGLVLYEMLTGTMAIQARSLAELTRAILMDPLPTFRAFSESLAPFDEVLAGALARSPNDRIADAASFLRGLEYCARRAEALADTAAVLSAGSSATGVLLPASSPIIVPGRTAEVQPLSRPDPDLVDTLTSSSERPPSQPPGAKRTLFLIGGATALAAAFGGVIWLASRSPATTTSSRAAADTSETVSASSPQTVATATTTATPKPSAAGPVVTATETATSSAAPSAKPTLTSTHKRPPERTATATARPTTPPNTATVDPTWGIPVTRPRQ